jgi:Zn-dependent M28 family amino/carboxypeptidase
MVHRDPPARPEAAAPSSALIDELARHVTSLAEDIGERNLSCIAALQSAASYIHEVWRSQGYAVERQPFEAGGARVENLAIEVEGTERAGDIVILGAHYDTARGSPGADDNASGVAALLTLSRGLAAASLLRTVRLVAFVNEEPPSFGTDLMGSRVYARRCKARSEHIVAMLALESIGYFSSERHSQTYPFPLGLFHPDAGNFIAVVGNLASRALVARVAAGLREASSLPCEARALPAWVPGVDLSDHGSFWQMGFRAAMITDTAPFRNPHYHQASDLPGTLDYPSLAQTVVGLSRALKRL